VSKTFNVPFVDLVTPHRELEDTLADVFRAALHTAGFVGGPMVEDFEKAFAEFCGTRHCVGVASGTDALRFALVAAGVQPGDCVITVPNTFTATVEAISQTGAMTAFVDIDERTYTLSPERLCEFLERRCTRDARSGRLVHQASGQAVKAVVPVHLYGQVADMDPILELTEHYGLITVEDACQAHGAEYYSQRLKTWQRAGTLGKAAAFSFYPGKNLGACGEAGAVTTQDEDVARKVRMLRDHGQSRKYYYEMEGYNGRLDAIQAGILRVKLRHLAEWNRARRELAVHYNELFNAAGTDCLVPFEPVGSKAVYHLYVIRVPDRDGLRDFLAKNRIGTGIHYPIALHLQKAYERLGYKEGDFPIAEKAAKEVLSLPMFPQLGREEQEYVASQVHHFFSKAAGTNPLRTTAVPAA
jgi:dTDP-4-amino-4,6-dideoxygalactose transaminase